MAARAEITRLVDIYGKLYLAKQSCAESPPKGAWFSPHPLALS
jgi:hypothetical protein